MQHSQEPVGKQETSPGPNLSSSSTTITTQTQGHQARLNSSSSTTPQPQPFPTAPQTTLCSPPLPHSLRLLPPPPYHNESSQDSRPTAQVSCSQRLTCQPTHQPPHCRHPQPVQPRQYPVRVAAPAPTSPPQCRDRRPPWRLIWQGPRQRYRKRRMRSPPGLRHPRTKLDARKCCLKRIPTRCFQRMASLAHNFSIV